MKILTVGAVLICLLSACSSQHQELQLDTYYMFTDHRVPQGPAEKGTDEYTVTYGRDIFKVRYRESQTNSSQSHDPLQADLHTHNSYDPDLSQVPQLGVPIRRCPLSKDVMPNGGVVLDGKATMTEGCMIQIGDVLQYEPPNKRDWEYVVFDILSEHVR